MRRGGGGGEGRRGGEEAREGGEGRGGGEGRKEKADLYGDLNEELCCFQRDLPTRWLQKRSGWRR